MKTIFEPATLGGLTIKNRLVRSATMEYGAAENGRIAPFLGELYNDLAYGGVGLIITGMMGVSPGSRVRPDMVRADGELFREDLAALCGTVHQHGCKIVVQLSHCGAKAQVLDGDGPCPLAPSDIVSGGTQAKAMSLSQVEDAIDAFAAAALTCKKAGADGVQIHAAHGYLVSQFLSPLFNRREDCYGGDIEGRSRLLLDVYHAIRAQVGPAFPILVKINYSDLAAGGVTGPDVEWTCARLSAQGIDAIEVSAGIGIDAASTSIRPASAGTAFNLDYALRVSQAAPSAAILTVGGYRTPDDATHALNAGNIEAVSLCRPLIREPGLPARWQRGDLAPATCVSCNKCFRVPRLGCYLDQG